MIEIFYVPKIMRSKFCFHYTISSKAIGIPIECDRNKLKFFSPSRESGNIKRLLPFAVRRLVVECFFSHGIDPAPLFPSLLLLKSLSEHKQGAEESNGFSIIILALITFLSRNMQADRTGTTKEKLDETISSTKLFISDDKLRSRIRRRQRAPKPRDV